MAHREKGALADSQSDHSRQADGLWEATPAGRFRKWSHISSQCPALGLIRGQEQAATAQGLSTHDMQPDLSIRPRNNSVKAPKDKSIYKLTSLGPVVLSIIKHEAWFSSLHFSNACQPL